MRYTIYQLPVEHDLCFMDYAFTSRHGGVNPADYAKVYTGEMPVRESTTALEQIYTALNTCHPEDYRARSLSVSDLVELEGGGLWFCDSIGFVAVEEPRQTKESIIRQISEMLQRGSWRDAELTKNFVQGLVGE